MDFYPMPSQLTEVAARLAPTLDMLEACVTSVRAGPLQALTRAQVWSGTGVASPGGHTDGLAAVESRMDPSEPSEQVLLNASATLRNLFRLYATRTSGRKHPAQPHAAANSHSSGGTMASSGGSSQPSGKPGGGTSRLGGQRWANSTHAGAPTTDAHGHGSPGHAPLMSSSSSPTSSAAGGDYELLLSSSRFSRMVREYDLLGRGFTTSWPVFLQAIGGTEGGTATTSSHGGPWMTLDQFSRCLESVAWQQFPECHDGVAALSALLLQRVVPKLQMLASSTAEELD
eukprot:jgi/Mesvir1/25656/Mv01873-RA.1